MTLKDIQNIGRKLIGKVKVKIMGRRSKREKRLMRKQQRLMVGSNNTSVVTSVNGNKEIASATINIGSNVTTHKGIDYTTWLTSSSNHYHYPTKVVTLGALNIWAATKSEILLRDTRYIDLIVNCSQVALTIGKNTTHITGNKAFDKLNKYIEGVNEVLFDWSDGSDLPVGLEFWHEFYDICIEQGYRNILFCCMGGHGRTGTGIACLVLANSKYEFNMSEEIIELVQARYCKNAIETVIQENYLRELEEEKKDTEDSRAEPVEWMEYTPKKRVIETPVKYGSPGNSIIHSGAKTLTQVIAEAKAAKEREKAGIDVFNGTGDESALELSGMEASQAANKAIVIDMLTAEERAKKEKEDAYEAYELGLAQQIIEYTQEAEELEKVKTNKTMADYQCFCAKNYECLSCEYLRLKGAN